MSFRVDLWNGINIIKTQYSSTLDKLTSFYNILVSYNTFQKSHCKNLESLYKDNKDKFKDDYLLDNSFFLFLENLKSESECLRKSYQFLKEEVIESLKNTLENEKFLFIGIISDGMQIIENFTKIKNSLINAQKNYNNSLKDFNDFISNIDESELQSVLEGDTLLTTSSTEINMSLQLDRNTYKKENKIQQRIAKKTKLVDKINENKNEYMAELKETNEVLSLYNDKYENVLQQLEEKYKILLNNIHLILTTIVGHKINYNNEINIIYNSYMENNLNTINVDNELMEFIIRNATKEFPSYKYEFIPIKFDNKKLDINKYLNELNLYSDKEVVRGKSHKNEETRGLAKRSYKKKNTCKTKNINIFELNSMRSNNANENKIKSNINNIVDYIEELITDKEENVNSMGESMDLEKIKDLLDKKNEENLIYLENIFKILNKNRAKGNFLINRISYNVFIQIFNYILDNYSNLDYILKNIIILSQTFYIFEKENGKNQLISDKDKIKSKVFIQDGLKKNPIFNNPEIWHRVINYTLSTHVCSKDISQTVDKNERNNKLNAIAFNTLVSYLCDIKYFTDDKNVFDKIKYFYVKVYNLNEDLVNKEINNK